VTISARRAPREKETSIDMTRKSIFVMVMFGCLAMALATLAEPRPAHAQSDQWNALYDRIIRLEHEVRGLASGGGGMPGNPAVMGEASYRVAAIEDQLRQILGVLDEIRRTQHSLELRLQQLEGSPRTTGSIFEQQPAPSQERESFDFSQYQARELAQLSAEQDVTIEIYRAPGPQVLGTISGTQLYEPGQFPRTGVAGDDGASLLPETVERAALDGSALPSTGDSADRLYESGYESLLGRRFGAAEGSFKMFLDRHGDHPLASDAHYWLGETYFVQGDYKQAAQSFLKGYRGYPEGRKAPETLFKLGLSLQQLEQKPQACSTFAEVAKNYPTAANVRNEALKEMQRAGC
jgi:tol-pal system protein YbgF